MKIFMAIFVCISSLAFSQIEKTTNTREASHISPQEALNKLIEGNIRYRKEHPLHGDSSKEKREATTSSQKPFAVILSCSDSRVAPEILFDQGIGDVFVIRIAGNVADALVIDSMQYAIKHLGASLIMVLGHENCGAVEATMKNEFSTIDNIGTLIKPALKNCKSLEKCVEANVESVAQLVKQSPLIQPFIEKNEIAIVGAYYELQTGKVKLLNK